MTHPRVHMARHDHTTTAGHGMRSPSSKGRRGHLEKTKTIVNRKRSKSGPRIVLYNDRNVNDFVNDI